VTRRRTRSSVRFDPYYKVQWYDPAQLAWRDARGRFATAEEARASAPGGRRCRVSEITMTGRNDIEEA
jgi:hypothetical protein